MTRVGHVFCLWKLAGCSFRGSSPKDIVDKIPSNMRWIFPGSLAPEDFAGLQKEAGSSSSSIMAFRGYVSSWKSSEVISKKLMDGTSLVWWNDLTCQLFSSKKYREKPTKKNFEDKYHPMPLWLPWFSRDTHWFHPAGLPTSQLKLEVGYLNLIGSTVCLYSKCRFFGSKKTEPFVFQKRFELNLER